MALGSWMFGECSAGHPVHPTRVGGGLAVSGSGYPMHSITIQRLLPASSPNISLNPTTVYKWTKEVLQFLET